MSARYIPIDILSIIESYLKCKKGHFGIVKCNDDWPHMCSGYACNACCKRQSDNEVNMCTNAFTFYNLALDARKRHIVNTYISMTCIYDEKEKKCKSYDLYSRYDGYKSKKSLLCIIL